MQAIVSVLDDPWREEVENIWGELKAVFGLKSVIGSTRPHFTFQVAEDYDPTTIDEALSSITAVEPPFGIETRGLGVFRGDEAVLYLAVVRDAALERMHERIWAEASGAATGLRAYYGARTWVPHITLAIGDLQEAQLPEIIAFLGRKQYEWAIPVTNLCLIADTSNASTDCRRYELKGPA